MNLKDQIIEDRLKALKSGDSVRKNLLGTLLVEIEVKSGTKNPTDDDCIKHIKKMIESNNECKIVGENEYLECYLPKQLTHDELTVLITDIININGYTSVKDTGKILSNLNEKYSGRFDGKAVSGIIKTLV